MRILPEVEGVGGNLQSVRQALIQEKFSMVFQLNNALIHVSHIQNETRKKECIWVRIRGTLLAENGAPS